MLLYGNRHLQSAIKLAEYFMGMQLCAFTHISMARKTYSSFNQFQSCPILYWVLCDGPAYMAMGSIKSWKMGVIWCRQLQRSLQKQPAMHCNNVKQLYTVLISTFHWSVCTIAYQRLQGTLSTSFCVF